MYHVLRPGSNQAQDPLLRVIIMYMCVCMCIYISSIFLPEGTEGMFYSISYLLWDMSDIYTKSVLWFL